MCILVAKVVMFICGVRVSQSLVFCILYSVYTQWWSLRIWQKALTTNTANIIVVFCRLSFAIFSIFFWPLYCLSFLASRVLITRLNITQNNGNYQKITIDAHRKTEIRKLLNEIVIFILSVQISPPCLELITFNIDLEFKFLF